MSHTGKPIRFTQRQRDRLAAFVPAPTEHRRKIEPDPCTFDAGRWQRVMLLAGTIIGAWKAAEKADMERALRERIGRVGAPEEWASASDRGTQGQAMQARGAKVEDVLVDIVEHAGGTYLERASVAVVRDGVIDHYERAGVLWGRRLEAVQKLGELYQRSGIAPGGARSEGGRSYGQMSKAQAAAWKDYCRAVDHLRPGERPVVQDVARGLFPAAMDAVAKLRSGAWDLANHFLLTPDKVVDRPDEGA